MKNFITIVAMAAVLFACGSREASRMTVELFADANAFPGLHVLVSGAETSRSFTLEDFSKNDVGLLETPPFEVASSGDLTISVELSNDVVASGSVSLELRENFNWSIDLFRQTDDPASECMGCLGSHGIEIAQSNERVWIVWAGQSDAEDDIIF